MNGEACEALLTALDLAHLFALDGPTITRARVLDYLTRAGVEVTDPRSVARRLDRARVLLARHGYEVVSEVDRRGIAETTLTLRNASRVAHAIGELVTESRLAEASTLVVLETIARHGQDGVTTRELRRELGARARKLHTSIQVLVDEDLVEHVPHAPTDQNRFRVTERALERSRDRRPRSRSAPRAAGQARRSDPPPRRPEPNSRDEGARG